MCHGGHLSFLILQVVKTPFVISVLFSEIFTFLPLNRIQNCLGSKSTALQRGRLKGNNEQKLKKNKGKYTPGP